MDPSRQLRERMLNQTCCDLLIEVERVALDEKSREDAEKILL